MFKMLGRALRDSASCLPGRLSSLRRGIHEGGGVRGYKYSRSLHRECFHPSFAVSQNHRPKSEQDFAMCCVPHPKQKRVRERVNVSATDRSVNK